MKTTASQKIKIGIFTIAGILLFVLGIFIIGSKQNMFGNTYKIYGTFNNVGGLGIGNNIRFAGINVGTVEDITIVSDSLVRVDMLMKDEVRPFIKTDAMASIGGDGLMGDKLITIVSGNNPNTELLPVGGQIRTTNPVDFDKIIAKFTNVANNAEIITNELAGMAIQIREGNGTISKLLYTDDLSKSLEGTARNAQLVTGSLANIASEIKSGRGSLGSLVYSDSLSNGLETAVGTANAAMLTIQEAADGFSENMKALQGNYFLRGYFKRKAEKEGKNTDSAETTTAPQNTDVEPDEAELREIIAEAQKALDEKEQQSNKTKKKKK